MSVTTKLNINLQVTLLSESEGKWLVTTTEKTDTPVAVVVDTAVKNALMSLQELYNRAPQKIIKCVTKHYKIIVSAVHFFEAEATAAEIPSQWASIPLIGETETVFVPSVTDNIPPMYEVNYCTSGEAVRILKGYLDENLYTALHYIAEDYKNYPELYYYVFTRYLSKFTEHIDKV